MDVYVERTRERHALTARTGKELLEQLGIPEAEALLVRGDEVILPEEELREEDSVRILSVISGG